ncbi:MAG: tetratricopeptide repeat protein, partial [Hyphomicrobium sp.]
YQVAQGPQFQSIIVAISGQKPSADCRPELPPGASQAGWAPMVTPETTVVSDPSWAPGATPGKGVARAAGRGAGRASEAQIRAAGAGMDEGRAAMRKNDYALAIEKFRAVLRLPETAFSADAQEMLALAYQRKGNTPGARAELEDYLTRYPSGEGADRVRQRLAGIVTADDATKPALRASKWQERKGGGDRDAPSTWTVSGSASQFYIRDDSFRTLHDPLLPRAINEEADLHRVHQNELLSSLDLMATWQGGGVKSKFRFSGAEEHRFDHADDRDIVSVAALYFETAVRDWGTEARIGRQTRNSGGVLGRFDGALVGYRVQDQVRVNAVVGSPVARRRDEPFMDEKLFYGVSVDFGPFFGGLDASVFFIEQQADSVLDRRAVGA